MANINECFGENVFNNNVMKERLSSETYIKLQKTMRDGEAIDISLANNVACAMKDWAIEKGATHFTHWFQPMTGITAEKHDGFITPSEDGNGAILDFSGKELIKGEPDASSFPSGGLRATFEARGYTAWDPTSYAFIKDRTLCIPTAFCSYTGEVLDKKTPLLRSMKALNTQAMRILRLFGNDKSKRVIPTVGPEQEYFLVDKKYYDRRKDLIFCGRTLFGAPAPKGQELEDHYFGALKPRVSAFMRDLDEELWKLGIYAKTEHNEVAPAQHELAPVYTTVNIAADHNQLTMEIMKKVALQHGLVCLLHEKPFNSVNGSGKHNNWSLTTDDGINLFNPGKTPEQNAQFLLFIAAVIKAVDDYQGLLRVSVASAGNDRRLGANEAPPAIISMFFGDELSEVLECIETGKPYKKSGRSAMELGVDTLPSFPKDSSDRNRTSPFAFTGNKFEFRMLGSTASVADPNIVINTIVADTLMEFADELETAKDFKKALNNLVRRTIKEHKRIIFDGNGYSQAWEDEAAERGLLNLRTTVDALPIMIEEKNIKLFERHKIYTQPEIMSRFEISVENYIKLINIEVLTMLDMTHRDYLPAISKYMAVLSKTINEGRIVNSTIPFAAENKTLIMLSSLNDRIFGTASRLESSQKAAMSFEDLMMSAKFIRDNVLPLMGELREAVDSAEKITDETMWPVPTYADLMFGV